MITPTDQEPAQEIKHTWWDVCNCEGCLDEAAKIDDDDEDLPKKRKSSQRKLKRRYEKEEPTQPPSPRQPPSLRKPPSPNKPPSPPPHKLSPYNQKALSIFHQDSPTKDKELTLSPVFPINKDPSCSYSQKYEQEFPALTAFEQLDSRTKHDWKIKNPTTIGPTGHANTINPAEATLNWKSENVVAQNKVLVKILSQQKSTVQFDAEDYEENQENPNQETSTGFPKSDIKQYFTFDDVPNNVRNYDQGVIDRT
nr:putative zinc finger, CCHC-type [Tanacetum cinerariifolium]